MSSDSAQEPNLTPTETAAAQEMEENEVQIESLVPGGQPLTATANDDRLLTNLIMFIDQTFLPVGEFTWPPGETITIVEVVESLNKLICEKKRSGGLVLEDWGLTKATRDVAEKIVQLAMECTSLDYAEIADIKKKNDKTDNYGEINLNQLNSVVKEMEEKRKLTRDDVFFDLGSGIGQVPLFLAAATDVRKAIGIEFLAKRMESAKKVKAVFEKLMKFFGKVHGDVILVEGDVRDHCEMIRKEATLLFTNNFSFFDLNGVIENEILTNCKNKTRVVSTAKFFAKKRGRGSSERIRAFNCHKVHWAFKEGSITSLEAGFSWTPAKVPIYMIERDDENWKNLKTQVMEEQEKKNQHNEEIKKKRAEKRRLKEQQTAQNGNDGQENGVTAAAPRKQRGRPRKSTCSGQPARKRQRLKPQEEEQEQENVLENDGGEEAVLSLQNVAINIEDFQQPMPVNENVEQFTERKEVGIQTDDGQEQDQISTVADGNIVRTLGKDVPEGGDVPEQHCDNTQNGGASQEDDTEDEIVFVRVVKRSGKRLNGQQIEMVVRQIEKLNNDLSAAHSKIREVTMERDAHKIRVAELEDIVRLYRTVKIEPLGD